MPTIVKGSDHMQVVTYTGNGSTQTIDCGFKPDLVWIKIRSAAGSHRLLDSVRGATNALSSNLTNAEFVDSTGVTAFTSTGFTVGADGSYNGSGSTYVAWCWKAGQGTTSSNTSGTITSTVSVNASAGFSVMTYTVPSSGSFTVGHGLGVAPAFVIHKSRSNVLGWQCYHVSLGNGQTINLNLTNPSAASSTAFGNTSPTSTVMNYGDTSFWGAGYTYVAYCFAPIAGYSAFGSLTGNGSTDGPMVYTGFQPRFVMIKASSATGNWVIIDTARDTYNVSQNRLFPNLSNAESAYPWIDVLSNGFKVRDNSSDINTNGTTYVYAAFASYPFKQSLAR